MLWTQITILTCVPVPIFKNNLVLTELLEKNENFTIYLNQDKSSMVCSIVCNSKSLYKLS